MEETRRLYLRAGETVIHLRHPEWGVGEVREEINSTIPGGISMVKISFSDGKRRVFNNDMDSEFCCYYGGVRRHG
ncbi:MAG: hypothetical protein A2W63_02915 [Deltaproteobacteria bacterium RIFCSPLOWO2_02_44_9]|nr:MAG: hypothetical protein A2W63_02915 [Deltaproteobacteria bacterium RIFCSPLOWO2_02_44_9]